MQSLRKPSIETQNFRCPQRFQEEERKPGWKEEEEEVGKVGKRGGLIDISFHLQIPRHYRTFSWASREGRTGTQPYQNRTRIRVLCQEEVISLQSSAQAEALWPNSCVQDQGIRKMGRIGRAKERKERGKGREVNKVSLPVGALWPVVHVRRRPGTRGSQLRPLGLVHWQASWPLSTPSGQDVSLSKEESHQSRHLLQEGGPLPGPETGLLSNTRKWIVRGNTCWQSKRFYWEGHPGGEQEGEGTQENCSATWLTVLGFMVMGLVSGGLWPIILIQSLSWWHKHCSANMDASERDSGKWTDTRCLLLTFPKLFPLVVAF